MLKNLPANAGDAREVCLIPGSIRFPWRRKWQPTPLRNPMSRGVWQTTVHGAAKQACLLTVLSIVSSLKLCSKMKNVIEELSRNQKKNISDDNIRNQP